MKFRGLAVIAAVVLAGCVTAEDKLRKNLDSWIGKPVAQYALQAGQPDGSFEMSPGRRAFQWTQYGQGPGMVMPMGRGMMIAPPQQTSCRITMVATANKPSPSLADWTIDTWNWNGNC